MAAPVLSLVTYLDPWGTLPPGHTAPGVQVTVSNGSQAPSGSILIARLLEAATPLVYGIGASPTYVCALPLAPLNTLSPYVVQAQWVPSGTNPASADWTAPGVVSAAVITAAMRITAGAVGGGKLGFGWEPATVGSATPGYGYVQVLDAAAGVFVALVLAAGSSGETPYSLDATKAYWAYTGGAALIDPDVPDVYTLGPVAPPLVLPSAAPKLTAVGYDGGSLAATWTPPPAPPAPAPPPPAPVPAPASYSLAVLAAGAVVASFPAAAGGGSASIDLAALEVPVTVAGQVAYGPVVGPLGSGQGPLAAAPVIASVTLSPASMEPADVGGVALGVVVAAPPGLPPGASLNVDLLQDGAVLASGVATGSPPSVQLSNVVLGAHRYAVTAQAALAATSTAPAVTGPAAKSAEVVPGPVTDVRVAYDGSALQIGWTSLADPALSGYRVAVTGLAQSSFTTGVEPQLSIPAALLPGKQVTVTVTPLAGVVAGLPSAASTYSVPAPAPPHILAATGEPGWARISWQPSPGSLLDGYAITLKPVGGDPTVVLAYAGLTTSAGVALPPLSPAAAWTATVAATMGGSAGPGSDPATLTPSTPPAGVSAVYDGSAVHVAWEPVEDAGVTGYTVKLVGSTPPVAPVYVAGAATAATTIAVALSGAFPGAATVTVQAAALVGAGPSLDGPASVSAIPTLAGSVRTVAATASGQPPYAARYGAYAALNDARGQDVVSYLASPFASGTPTVTDAGLPPTFTLAPVLANGAAYQLTIAKSVWTSFDGSAARVALRASYRAFLALVEAKGVTPAGIALVRQAIATAMPQTFAETLYYRYGLWRDATLRAVDLDPGLRLRLSGATYQVPSGAEASPVNGFVALGTEEYDLAATFPSGSGQSGLAPSLTVDAFLASLLPGGGTAAGTTVAAGTADFFGPGARQAYYRVFYPERFPPSGGTGSSAATDNVALVGAPSWTALENATDTYVKSGSLPVATGLFVAYFRGRAMLTPLAAVCLDGQQRWVPVGTSVRQLLAGTGAPEAVLQVGLGVALTRQVASVLDSPRGGSPLRAEPMDLSGAALGTLVPQLWPLDLPLLGGDEVVLTPAITP